MDEYKDFSKQDLVDRKDALEEDWYELKSESSRVFREIRRIEKLLDEKNV